MRWRWFWLGVQLVAAALSVASMVRGDLGLTLSFGLSSWAAGHERRHEESNAWRGEGDGRR